MKETIEERVSNATSLLDVLLILKEKTMLDTHVATLAYTKSIKEQYDSTLGYGILECLPFPLDEGQEEYSIFAYCFNQNMSDLKNNSRVLIIFTDKNFIMSLNAVDRTPKQTNDHGLHLIKYGIVIPLNESISPASDEQNEELLDF